MELKMRNLFVLAILLFCLAVLVACGNAGSTAQVPELDRSNPVPMSSEFVTVAYDSGITLQYRADLAIIRVIDRQGNIWESTPADIEECELARGQIRMALQSMITVSFLSGQGNDSTETAMAASIRTGDFGAYLIPGGVRVEFYFPAQRTRIPVEITLEDGTMLAAVRPEHIQRTTPAPDADESEWEVYDRNHRLTQLGLLPHFMHAGMQHEGYILVPDGSGALIHLNNGRPRATFSQPVFGPDSINPPVINSTTTQNVLMPVFGMARDNSAIFAIIEGGAALATIHANTSGNNSSYNSASASFVMRPPGTYTVTNAQGVQQQIMVTSDWLVGVDAVSVRYFFMEENAGYSEMAALYRSYLVAQGLTRSPVRTGVPLVLDVYGSVTRRMSVLGVPTNRNIPLTSFEQGSEMVSTLRDGGVEHLVVRYNNWMGQGNYATSPNRFSPSRRLGGTRGFNDFADEMENLGVSLYMEVDFATAHSRPFLGFIGTPVIRNISNMPVQQFDFDLSVFTATDEPSRGWWLYSPRTMANQVDRFVSRASSQNISGISMSTLNTSPYGDVGRRHMDRGVSEIVFADIAASTRDEMHGLMGNAASAFWLPHASFVINTPLSCSGFAITDESVPFYQMVLHGYLDFSLPSYNLATDREGMVLRAAETGALLQLSVIAENPALLVETPLEWLFSPSFDYWHTEVLAAANRLAPVYEAVAGSVIQEHANLENGVTQTTFANGTTIFVNYSRNAQTEGGITIPARDFVIIAGGAQ